MDAANSWAARLLSASKRYQSALHSRSGKRDVFYADTLMGLEDAEMDDEIQEEYPCPFCSEYFDIVGLCCHIDDEHPVQANNGVCPVCAVRVGVDMVAHITLQHGSIFKRKRKSQKAGANSTISLFKQEMREANFRSLFGVSSRTSTAAPDPLLSSFIRPMGEEYVGTPSSSMVESAKKNTVDSISERKVERQPPLSSKDQEKKAKRCNFVQELLLSTMLDGSL